MKEIGGYFEIEYTNVPSSGIHTGARKLNSGRFCFEYIIKARKYTKIYLPYFICDVMYEPLVRNNIEVALYHINERMEAVALPEVMDNEAFLYVNYFGFKKEYIDYLAKNIKNLVVDNCQALYAEAVEGIDTFYSLRKFAGVPDGGFLYCTADGPELPPFNNIDHTKHLYLRRNVNANTGFPYFLESEEKFSTDPMSAMSVSASMFIEGYDFAKSKQIREQNFLMLHHHFAAYNECKAIDIDNICGPLYYPFLINKDIRSLMISNKLYVNVIWPNLHSSLPADAYERYLAAHLFPLPIDHRYGADDMQRIVDVVMSLIK